MKPRQPTRTLREHPADLGRDVRERLALGGAISARTYLAARREREMLRGALMNLLDEFDVTVGPTVPVVAPTREEAADLAVRGRLARNPRLANIVGLPAISDTRRWATGRTAGARADGAALSAAELVSACLR